jgi:PPOX class probable F420-dependent enzyme
MPSAAKVPESHANLLRSKALVFLSTVNKDGSPQVSPVWFDTEGDLIRVNSAKGRLKDKNMRARKKVSLALVDPQNMYRWLGIQGTVVEITETGADAHIDSLAKKYLDKDTYPNRRPGEVRVTYKIKPDKAFTMP